MRLFPLCIAGAIPTRRTPPITSDAHPPLFLPESLLWQRLPSRFLNPPAPFLPLVSKPLPLSLSTTPFPCDGFGQPQVTPPSLPPEDFRFLESLGPPPPSLGATLDHFPLQSFSWLLPKRVHRIDQEQIPLMIMRMRVLLRLLPSIFPLLCFLHLRYALCFSGFDNSFVLNAQAEQKYT